MHRHQSLRLNVDVSEVFVSETCDIARSFFSSLFLSTHIHTHRALTATVPDDVAYDNHQLASANTALLTVLRAEDGGTGIYSVVHKLLKARRSACKGCCCTYCQRSDLNVLHRLVFIANWPNDCCQCSTCNYHFSQPHGCVRYDCD